MMNLIKLLCFLLKPLAIAIKGGAIKYNTVPCTVGFWCFCGGTTRKQSVEERKARDLTHTNPYETIHNGNI